MEIYDISIGIQPTMLVWPGVSAPIIKSHKAIESGDSVNDRDMCINLHTGSHMDAPEHFIKDGLTIDKVAIEQCYGRAYVLEVDEHVINEEVINYHRDIFKIYERVIFKTKNSQSRCGEFNYDFSAFDESGAKAISKYPVKLVGIDYLSIQKYGKHYDMVHKILLKNMIILENLELRDINPGEYILSAFPIKIIGAEAAPVRAVLIKE
jgi:arylformamidase